MSVLLFLRHGQASMGSPDYDQLSELGHRQARLAGVRLAAADLAIGEVWCGGLVRQRDTVRAVLAETGQDPGRLRVDERLDEYDHLGVLAGHTAGDGVGTAGTAGTAAAQRALQSALDEAIRRWMTAGADPRYGESHDSFVARVTAVAGELTARPGTTLAVTSAGVIAVACARLLGLAAEQWPDLAAVVVNASLTKIVSGRGGTHLITFNDHAHLEGDRSLITYR